MDRQLLTTKSLKTAFPLKGLGVVLMQAGEKLGTWVWGGEKRGIRVIFKSLFLWGDWDPTHRQSWHLRVEGTKNQGTRVGKQQYGQSRRNNKPGQKQNREDRTQRHKKEQTNKQNREEQK